MKQPAPMCATLLALAILVSSPPAFARMYQWDDPDTGTPQLSGKPPWWYRGSESGPRVFVIDNGRVVDDTAVSLPEAQRQQLREAAFRQAEQDESRLKAKLEESQRLQAERRRKRADDVIAADNAAPAPAETTGPEQPAPEGKPTPAEAEAMRALVEEWEKAREESAKKIIQQ